MQNITKQILEFTSLEIKHPIYKAVLDEVLLQVECPTGFEFFAVFGPPGVGKSTMCQTIGTKALEFYSSDSPPLPGELPIVQVTAPAAPRGRPDWKELFCRIIEELNQPLATASKVARPNPGFAGGQDIPALLSKTSTQAVRRALRNAIDHRKTRLILIDEGQHVCKGLNTQQVGSEMDNLKNLAAETGCLIGFVGTYELLPVLTANGQLSRRVTPVHYPRYSPEDEKFRQLFEKSFMVFVDRMPLEAHAKEVIKASQEFLYSRTAGCIGTLATVLGKICWRSLRTAQGSVKDDIIQRCALLAGCSRTIRKEIAMGETQWTHLMTEDPELESANVEVAGTEISVEKKTRLNQVPGRPNPKRRHVGPGERIAELEGASRGESTK